jgi:hypothetical protein
MNIYTILQENIPMPIVEEAGWIPGPICTVWRRKNSYQGESNPGQTIAVIK